MIDPYALTTHDGKTVDMLTHYALLECERRLGYPLTILQGSYHAGVSQSAGTHDGGGAVDLTPWDWENKVRVMRAVGFCAWHRAAIPGTWGEHVHGILRGDAKMSPSAARQVASYDRGRDGLAGDGVDTFPYHPTIAFQMPQTQPVTVGFSNLNQFQKGDSEHIAYLASKADVLTLVECINADGTPVPVVKYVPQGWRVAQDLSSSAKAGSAVAWDVSKLTAYRAPQLKPLTTEVVVNGKVLVRDRFMMIQPLRTVTTGEKYRIGAGHFPPNDGPAYRAAWPAGIDRVRRIRRRPLLPPLVAGFDRNDDIDSFADDLHMIAEGRGIVGILVPPKRVRVLSHEIDDHARMQGWTDHYDVFATIERKP